jgi:cell division protein FtsB
MSKTPRTDKAAWMELVGFESNELHVVEADFARQLERELAAVTAERDELRGQVSTLQGRIAFERRNLLEAEAERDELRAAAGGIL